MTKLVRYMPVFLYCMKKNTLIYIYIKCMIGSVQTKGGGEGSNVS